MRERVGCVGCTKIYLDGPRPFCDAFYLPFNTWQWKNGCEQTTAKPSGVIFCIFYWLKQSRKIVVTVAAAMLALFESLLFIDNPLRFRDDFLLLAKKVIIYSAKTLSEHMALRERHDERYILRY